MNGLVRILLLSIVGSVIFAFVFAYFTNPLTSTQVNSFFSSTTDEVGKLTSQGLVSNEDPIIIVCQNNLNDKIAKAKERAFAPLVFEVREYKKFNSTEEAISYLKDWGFIHINEPPYFFYN